MHADNTIHATKPQIPSPVGASSPGEGVADFLQLIPGVHQLGAIDPATGFVEGLTCRLPEDRKVVEKWVNDRNGKKGMYWSINEVHAGFTGKKPTKSDIVAVRFLHLDADTEGANTPAAMLSLGRQIEEKTPVSLTPTFAIDSGGGFQHFFQLAEPLSLSEDRDQIVDAVEAQNNGLIRWYDGDFGTQNIDRWARLPGTENVPNAKKLARGRVQRTARLISSSAAQYDLASFADVIPPVVVEKELDRSPEIAAAQTELEDRHHESCCGEDYLPEETARKLAIARKESAGFDDLWVNGLAKNHGRKSSIASYLAWRSVDFTLEECAQIVWCYGFIHERHDYCDTNLRPRDIARAYVNIYLKNRAKRDKRNADRDVDHFDYKAAEANAPTSNEQDGQTAKAVRRLPLTPFREAADTALDHSNKPLVQGLLDQGTLSVIYGPSNAGKTFVVLNLAFHIATGLPWGGMKTTRGTALYIAAEGGPGARKRARALQKRFGQEGHDVDIEFVLSTINLLDPKADLEPLIATMNDLAAAGRPVVFLVIDTFSRVFAGGEENGSTDMGTMVAHFDRIRQATAAHVCIVHHSGKQIAKGARGHSLLRAATDTEIEVVPGHIVVTKQRDLEGNYSVDFKLAQVEIGAASDGSAVTSAVVELVSRGAGEPGVATQAEQIVLDAVALAVEGAESDQENPQTFGVADIAAVLAAQGREISTAGLRKHFGQLVAKRLIKNVGRGVYALRAPETAYSQYFQHLTDEEVEKTISERMGVGSGASVFD